MAQYTPKTWTTGETITAAELNAIEQAAATAAVAADVTTAGTPTGDALRAAYGSLTLGAVSRLTVLGHSYAMGDKNTRGGGWLGSGNTTVGSTAISGATTFSGTAAIGQAISGPGIPDGATITAVTSGVPTAMSLPASEARTPANLSAGAIREVRWPGRVAAALRAKERNYAKNGSLAWLMNTDQGGFATALQEFTSLIQAAPYLPAHQVVAIATGLNDLGTYDNLPRLMHAIRLMVSRARAAAIFEETHASVAYTGAWTGGSGAPYNSGGTSRQSPANPTSAAITVTMPADFPASAVASFVFALAGDDQTYRTDGLYQFTRGGPAIASLDTRNLMGATGNVMEVCQRVTGLSAGDVVTITFPVAPAGYVFFDCWMIEAPTAPLTLLLKQPLLTSTGYSAYTTTPVTDARVQTFNTALDTLAAEFADGMVSTVDLSALDHATAKMASDQLHPNEQGHAEIADAVLRAIANSKLTRLGVLSGAGQRGY